jgi:hypothetical protein
LLTSVSGFWVDDSSAQNSTSGLCRYLHRTDDTSTIRNFKASKLHERMLKITSLEPHLANNPCSELGEYTNGVSHNELLARAHDMHTYSDALGAGVQGGEAKGCAPSTRNKGSGIRGGGKGKQAQTRRHGRRQAN